MGNGCGEMIDRSIGLAKATTDGQVSDVGRDELSKR